MRDYIVLAFLLSGAAAAVFRPYVGIIFWCIVSYMNPHRFTWGIAYDFPVAYVVGGGTFLGLLFTKDRTKLPMARETVLLLVLWLLYVITTNYSLYPAAAWARFISISKILLMTGVTMMLVTTKQRFRGFLLTIALSIGFLAVKGGIFALRFGGADRIFGPPGSTLEDNNDFALANVMILPTIFYLARDESKQWMRMALRATGVLSIVTIIFTYSRGGFVGLAAVTGTALLKSKKKLLAGFLLLIAVAVAFVFVPPQWVERMYTIGDKTDESALGRINAWHFAYNLATQRFFGGGFDTFTPDLFVRYAPNPVDFHAAHSIYFEMLGEQGFVGLALFLAILASTFFTLQGLQHRYRRWPEMRWVADYAAMVQIGFVGYVTSGAFLGRANFDLYYHLVASAVILKTLAREEEWKMRQAIEEEPDSPEPPAEDLLNIRPAPV